jgi:lysozyme
MNISDRGLALIKEFEGCHKVQLDGTIKSYQCPALIWTIGYGSTIYPNGQKVGPKDVITRQRAEEIFRWHVGLFVNDVNSLLKTHVTQEQFDALVSFAYNVGSDIDIDLIAEGLGDSTLLKKVNANPNDPTIANEFNKWVKANGQTLPGLVKRRAAESKLYFNK